MVDPNMFVKEMLRLGVYLQREGARMAREYGLTQQQFVVLVAVSEQGSVTQKEIVSYLLYEKSNVSKSIARLEKMGYVLTRRSHADGRMVECAVTESGRQTVAACMKVMRQWNEKWLRGVPPKELAAAWAVLHGLGPMA
ncbi:MULTISPECIES: MarR family transcriptional regulator [unclassified Pseudodesulfovibrio]|uniref:MarR family winged helix-turn-helix transcriptional regulator n=1 Tax=unclassified Pseudodesulfovibrio TaxID=2661612 RepID=UPI000FEBB8CE|nr:MULTISPECIES: MarR family transcriptional regulator [unclassified Pseudodesulfovibrio]MCJ2163150.1 MarR family transcriptional regulator [Pseudodesulfovibrio sp. S3-i]RWU07141.1 MarR family transcriptional regulator [Pseudodesulfovibrio sp. S3]